jgi:uncharacterized protein (TIGR00299 family) protein
MKTLYLDCFMGVSGDMLLGAFLDLGLPFEELDRALGQLGVAGFKLTAKRVVKCGVSATQFHVHTGEHVHAHGDHGHGHHEHTHEHHHHDHDHPHEHTHPHGHNHSHDHVHRNLRDILAIIERSGLPSDVKEASEMTFHAIAEAEAYVHDTTPDEIHFHEVGAIDSIVDVIGTHFAVHQLGVGRIVASPVHMGSGTVECAHGVMPVPAPATALLLEGVPSYGGQVKGELATPTGAALVRQLAADFGPMPTMRITKTGYGAGTRNYADRPNVLRAILGEAQTALPKTEPIVIVETNVDDMNPELLPVLIAQVITDGAKDAFLTPVLGKKGRPGHVVTVLCDESSLSNVVHNLFSASTTLGIRIRREERICLDRKMKRVKTPWGDVRVKVGYLNGDTPRTAPEFEDCRKLAEDAKVPVLTVYQSALAEAIKGELLDA